MNPNCTLWPVFLLLSLLAMPYVVGAQDFGDNRTSNSKGNWNLEDLENSLGKHRRREVAFREAHFSTLLTEPLETKGTLTFTAPSRLEKHVTFPYEERYVVDENEVTFESSGGRVSRTLSLDDFPSLRGFVDGLRAAFTGDLRILKKFFDLSLDGERSDWRLELEPTHETTRHAIDTIRITGKQDEVTSIEIRESSGDYSRIDITPHPG